MTMINAWAVKEAGGRLEPFSYEVDALGMDEVEIDVTSCGICHSDLSMIKNDWRISQYPLVPGHEVIGRVSAVGSTVSKLKVGQTVGVGWYVGSCLTCNQCMQGDHHHCGQSRPTIVHNHGGFADKLRVQAAWAVPVPESLTPEAAGPLFCGGVTVFTPIVDYGIKPTDRVGVIGIGGLGHLAVKFLRAWGCEVWAFTSSSDKQQELQEMGAHHVANSRDEAGLKKMRGKFDAIISTVNVPLPWNKFVSALAPRGRLISVGAVPAPIEVAGDNLISGQKSVGGSAVGSPSMVAKMLEFSARHNIAPQIEKFPMEQVNDAIAHLEAGKARYRVVLTR